MLYTKGKLLHSASKNVSELTISSKISLTAEMQSIMNRGMAVVYWPVGETFGICCDKHNIHAVYLPMYIQ